MDLIQHQQIARQADGQTDTYVSRKDIWKPIRCSCNSFFWSLISMKVILVSEVLSVCANMGSDVYNDDFAIAIC